MQIRRVSSSYDKSIKPNYIIKSLVILSINYNDIFWVSKSKVTKNANSGSTYQLDQWNLDSFGFSYVTWSGWVEGVYLSACDSLCHTHTNTHSPTKADTHTHIQTQSIV